MRVQSYGQTIVFLFAVFAATLTLGHSQTFGQVKKDATGPQPRPQKSQDTSSLKLTQKQADAIQVQMDTEGPVFVYGSRGGGLVVQAAGQKTNPKIQVFSDGKIVVGGSIGVPRIESKFTELELVEFLDFVVNKNKFYELDSADIKKRIGGKENLTVRDANSSVFMIELQQGKHEVAVYALWNAIKNFPDFEEIQRLAAIEQRCNAEISKVHLGDRGDKVLKTVNKKVAELELGLAPFTLKEMRLAARRANGRFQVSFQRAWPNSAGDSAKAPNLMHAIYFVKDADSEPQVTFYNLPKKK
jgi:hypothetical protein